MIEKREFDNKFYHIGIHIGKTIGINKEKKIISEIAYVKLI